jgi:hypothetical protein
VSQVELHCLALSLFPARATLPESPFRLVVIEDPAQSMDPAWAGGLARLLHQVTGSRQVVVFTHDDRLPSRPGNWASTPGSSRSLDRTVPWCICALPSRRSSGAVDDAMALAKTDELPPAVARRVPPLFCCLALEGACTDVVRRRASVARPTPR